MKFPQPVKYRIFCHIALISNLVKWFINSDANTFVFLGYVLSEIYSSFEQNNFIYC